MLLAYITKDLHWAVGAGIGWLSSEVVMSFFREPGTYRFTTTTMNIRLRDGSLKNDAFSLEQYSFICDRVVEKMINGRWVTIKSNHNLEYWQQL